MSSTPMGRALPKGALQIMAKSIFDSLADKKQNPVGYTRENGLLVPERQSESERLSVGERPDFMIEDPRPKPNVRTRKPASRHIQVFDMKSVASARDRVKRTEAEQKRRLMPEVELAAKNEGKREIPKLGKLPNVLKNLETNYPNFSDAISAIGEEFALAMASRPSDFRISPLLLNGVPGIGKTAFSQELAEKFGLPFLNINAGNLQHAATIVGTDSHWANSAPGEVFSHFADNESATGIVLVDEVDKLNTSPEYGILPALLELLEPETSRIFKDVSMDIVLDASHLIILMTSNVRSIIDKALLSRARIFEVAQPSNEQRVSIVRRWIQKFEKQNRSRIKPTVDFGDIERMADLPMDLRALHRTLRSSVGRALLEKSERVEIKWDSLEQQLQERRPIGFTQQ